MKNFFSGLKIIFKKYFIAGAVVLIPIVGTLWILQTLILWMDGLFTSFIPRSFQPENLFGLEVPGLGLAITVALILLTGVLTRLYMGNKLIQWGDQFIQKIPFGRGIYSALKQFLGTMASEESNSFKKAVLVEFPTQGTYTIGLVTGQSFVPSKDMPGKKMVSVFIPTAPNPTSGYLTLVEESRLIPLSISTEKAFKTIISVGVGSKED